MASPKSHSRKSKSSRKSRTRKSESSPKSPTLKSESKYKSSKTVLESYSSPSHGLEYYISAGESWGPDPSPSGDQRHF